MAGRTALAKLTQVNSEKNSNASERSKHSIKHWLKQMQSLGVTLTGSTEQITSINTPEQLSYMELFNVCQKKPSKEGFLQQLTGNYFFFAAFFLAFFLAAGFLAAFFLTAFFLATFFFATFFFVAFLATFS